MQYLGLKRLITFSAFLAFTLVQSVAFAGETDCTNGKDDDNDSMVDCADADCANAAACKPDGQPENTNARCSDWVDNDDNGAMDCDDMNCRGEGITVCQGSWDTMEAMQQSSGQSSSLDQSVLPELGEGKSFEDLIGTMGDNDGERNDLLCSDGRDNDGDGRVDCADFGCRFSPDVTVCRGNPGMRFSIVGAVSQNYDFIEEKFDTRFTKLQLRSFGPIPMIQDSFYLLSMRAEKTPRLTFAMFQIPLGNQGHYMNINSGGGGLSNAMIISSAKQLLLDPAYYLSNAFEQGNGAAVEFGGPLNIGTPGMLSYRVYAAGGSGRYAGNIGGRYFTYDNTNYTYSAGAQLGINAIGHYSRWDSPFMLTPASTALAFRVGAKYDQRAQERYPAANLSAVWRWNRMILLSEVYGKRELNFGSWQMAYNATLGVLVWPKHVMLAADVGQFMASEFDNPPETLETDLRKIKNELRWRVAAHYYFWSNIGIATLLYTDATIETPAGEPSEREQELRLVAQFRF